jgi:hypothetical protein
MSHSFKQHPVQIMGTAHRKPKIKSFESKVHRNKIRQLLHSVDLNPDTAEEIENKVDVVSHDTHMEHKLVGTIDIHEKARKFAEIHQIDERLALDITHHRAIGK